MGGGYYEGDVEERSSATSASVFTYGGHSANAPAGPAGVHATLDPRGRALVCGEGTPIVVALDVTRSRGDDARVIFGKLPMLVGQIHMRGYVEAPLLSFSAIGDATIDKAPLQVGAFAADNTLDDILRNLWLEGGGGGTGQESYELCAYYYAEKSDLACVQRGAKGYFFFVGDEGFYPTVSKALVQQVIGDALPVDLSSKEVFRKLQERFHVFFIYPQQSWQERVSDIDAEIQQRVVAAGGMHGGVDIRASLLWNNRNDLDLHMKTPSGEHIYFGAKRASCSGELDVDRNVHGETTKPVENIRWAKGVAPKGRYTVWVENFSFHETSHAATPFKVELEVNGVIQHIESATPDGKTHSDSAIHAFTFDYDPLARPTASGEPSAYSGYDDATIKAQWAGVIPPEHILTIEHPKAIADIILGALALSGGMDLDAYLADMDERGQTSERKQETAEALNSLAGTQAIVHVSQSLLPATPSAPQQGSKTRRL